MLVNRQGYVIQTRYSDFVTGGKNLFYGDGSAKWVVWWKFGWS